MDHGAYTGELGYRLYNKFIDTNYMLYYDHPRKDKNDEPNCSHPTPFFDEYSNATKLSYVDIAVVNKERNSIELIVEIEESGAEPKKVIGDVVNIILSDQMRIKGKDYTYGKLTFILGVNVNSRGASEEKTKKICKKLIRINEKVDSRGKKIIMSKESMMTFERTVTDWIQKHPLSVYWASQDATLFLSQEFSKNIEAQYKAANRIIVSQEHSAEQIRESIRELTDRVSRGFEGLQAAFEWGVSEIVWAIEQQKEVLLDILEVLQAPLDAQAKELKKRGEEAFRNGWYDDAEKDFLESEEKNRYDFTIHWYIGYIYLFHKPNPTKALKYFENAVKYATPKSTYYAANALRHVGLIHYLQKNFKQAYESTRKAIQLQPNLYDAHYEHAQYCACLGKYDGAIQNLRIAITEGNRLYVIRADSEEDFNTMEKELEALEIELRDESCKKAKIEIDVAEKLIQEVESKSSGFDLDHQKARFYDVLAKAFSDFDQSIVKFKEKVYEAKRLFKSVSYFNYLDAQKIVVNSSIEFIKKIKTNIKTIVSEYTKLENYYRVSHPWSREKKEGVISIAFLFLIMFFICFSYNSFVLQAIFFISLIVFVAWLLYDIFKDAFSVDRRKKEYIALRKKYEEKQNIFGKII